MGSIAEGGTQDPRRSLGDFIVELECAATGPVDTELCRRLWVECAGRARFAASVLRAAAAAGVTVDPESVSFADWVVELRPPLTLALGPGDVDRGGGPRSAQRGVGDDRAAGTDRGGRRPPRRHRIPRPRGSDRQAPIQRGPHPNR